MGASMVVSYTRSQDALLLPGGMGSVVRGNMRDLTDIHAVVQWGMTDDHKVYNWYGCEYSAGGLVLRAFSWLLY